MSLSQTSEPTIVAMREPREPRLGTCRPEELRGLRARANHALPDGDPLKITLQWVNDLHIAASELRILRRALLPGDEAAMGLSNRLVEYACVIASVIETPDGRMQRGD